MSKQQFAKLFRNGRSQAVRLPKEFRFRGDRVRIRRTPEGVLLQPAFANIDEWFAAIDQYRTSDFMRGGRRQPKPHRRKLFD